MSEHGNERKLNPDEAAALLPGADHYRAYVGPPERYGLLGLLQIGLLHQLGLKETDKVLDFGCGSLRLGRILIPFLREGGYFGIEPNMWLVDEGFARELGEDARRLKRPRFSDDATFDCRVFGATFDFIMAQSIITHSGQLQTERLFETAAAAMKPGGRFVLSWLPAAEGSPLPEAAWTYPLNVCYPASWLAALSTLNGLAWRLLDWPHPGAKWGVAEKPRA